ncbi:MULTISPECIES: hypothetical protein [Anoxybacillus]|uniref:Uncharacterized protein n=1 Tax=Anoxybacillus mongoliensis TaxID=452565 RepID=A0A7W8JCH8_9BACL|nr:hypothetical protein [Anoxybacillus mongoliensis]MBB5354412.1 hypothetical protein [Anoxybacillus mongoliensis]
MKERDNYEWDIDRMINEGMAGGYVYSCHHATNIEEARDVQAEQPPHEVR